MTTNTKQEEMCEKFQSLFKYYTPNVDFIILDEKEKEVDKETGAPVGNYKLEFQELKEYALNHQTDIKHGCMVGFNGGVFSAFDVNTETFVVSARPDIYRSVFGVSADTGLFVPFSQHDTVPANTTKAAAYRYQEAYSSALYYKHIEKNGEQMVECAEQAETYKLQAMGEEAKLKKKQSLLEYLKSQSYSERFQNAKNFMSEEDMRQYSAENAIKQERAKIASALATKRASKKDYD